MMKKMLIAAMLSLACAFPLPAFSGQILLQVAHTAPLVSPWHKGFVLFKNEVEKNSNGSLKVEIFEERRFGNPNAVATGLQSGVLAIAMDSNGNLSPWSPRLMLLDLPFQFRDAYEVEAVMDSELGQEMVAGVSKVLNSTYLGYNFAGFRAIGGTRAVRNMDEMKGFKLRTTASKAEIAAYKALGANPTPMFYSEIFTALQQKTLDGLHQDVAYVLWGKFEEVVKHVTRSQVTCWADLAFVSNVFWNRLDDAQKKVVRDAWAKASVYTRQMSHVVQNDTQAELERRGVTFHTLTLAERERMIKATAAVKQEYAKSIGADFLKRVDDKLAEVRKNRVWW